MKILLYTDVHWSMNSSIIQSRGIKYSTRLENLIKSVNWAEHLAEEHGCDKIVCLGDFFDKPTLNAEEITALKEIEWANISHTFLIGNHETDMQDLQYASCHALPDDFEIVDGVAQISTFDSNIYFISYTQDKSIKDFGINKYDKNTIIFSHNDIAGIQYGATISKVGFNINEIEESCDLFVNGHIHNGDTITKKVINLGNLSGQNFSENAFNYKHHAMILDTITMEWTLYENPFAFNFHKITFKDIPNIPKKYGTVVSIELNENELKMLDKKILNGIIYKLNIKSNCVATNVDEALQFKVDHLEKFKECVYEKLGINDLVTEELNYICN